MERYGLELTADMRRQILAAIRGGKARFISRNSIRSSVHDVTLGGKTFRVVYDRERREIVTFLPPNAQTACRRRLTRG
jgi:hypothetical protein